MRVGLLHPGEMGAVIGDVLLARGHDVAWASEGRGAATRERAGGLTELPTVEAVASGSDVVLSVCPPHAALAVARDVAAAGFAGVFVDANAVSPSTARAVGGVVIAAGASFVDGGIVGGPPVPGASTRLYLAGDGAQAVADLFVATPLQAIVLDGGPGAASALKVCYAAYTKGTTALLLAIRSLAEAEEVDDALLAEWGVSQPDLVARSDAGPRGSARKAWRFAGEMDEIADAFDAAGLPDGFHRSAAELYRRLDGFKDASAMPSLADLIASARLDPATDRALRRPS